MSVKNNPVSGKEIISPVQHNHSKNIIIAHARMRTPTEEWIRVFSLVPFEYLNLFLNIVMFNQLENHNWPDCL